MNTAHWPRRLITLILFSLISHAALATSATDLHIASGVRSPHSTPAQDGFIDRLVSEAFRQLGYTVVITPLPAKRALQETNTGNLDADLVRVQEIPHSFTNLRTVPEKLIDFDFMVFTRHARLTPQGWDSLKAYEVGIISGWKILERQLKGSRTLTLADDTRQLMRLLAQDRVDLVVSERWQGLQAIQDLGLSDVHMLEPPVKSREMFLMLHKRHAALIPRLTKTLRKMKQDGRYQHLFSETLEHLSSPAKPATMPTGITPPK